MYLHLGQNTIVHESEILGIFDLDNASWAYKTREFLERAEQEGRIISVCDDLPISEELPKSFVVCAKPKTKGNQTVYIAQLSSQTLLRRWEAGIQTD